MTYGAKLVAGLQQKLKAALSLGRKMLVGVGITSVMLLTLELGFRLWVGLVDTDLGTRIALQKSDAEMAPPGGLLYEPHPYWVFNHAPSDTDINKWGFSGEVSLNRTPGVPRLLCMGGSTTAGPHSWPSKLKLELEKRRGSPVEVINMGVGGWTSAESLVAFTMLGQSFSPDVVILHHANNDMSPLRYPGFRPDYAHYRHPISMEKDELGMWHLRQRFSDSIDKAFMVSSVYGYLRLWVAGEGRISNDLQSLTTHDTEVTAENWYENAGVFQRNLRTIGVVAQGIGATTVLTTLPHRITDMHDPSWEERLETMNELVVRLGQEEGWPTVPLHAESWDPELFEDMVHMTDEGARLEAKQIADTVGPLLR